jgi:hypothetical protein
MDLATVNVVFDDSAEANIYVESTTRPPDAFRAGLDDVFRFSPGPLGFPKVARGYWADEQTFVLEYDNIANNDHMTLQFHYEGDRVTVHIQETAHDTSVEFEGWLQEP